MDIPFLIINRSSCGVSFFVRLVIRDHYGPWTRLVDSYFSTLRLSKVVRSYFQQMRSLVS